MNTVKRASKNTLESYKRDLELMKEFFYGQNIVEVDNEVTALLMYNEIAYEIATHAKQFANDGVEIEDMRDKLENIESHVAADIEKSGQNDTRVDELESNLQNNMILAERELEIVEKSLGEAE